MAWGHRTHTMNDSDQLKAVKRAVIDDWIEVLSASQRRSLSTDLHRVSNAGWNDAIEAAAVLLERQSKAFWGPAELLRRELRKVSP